MTIKRSIQNAVTTAKIVATVANTHPTPQKQFSDWQQVRNTTPTSQVTKPTSNSKVGKK